jgi:hypothetical protein
MSACLVVMVAEHRAENFIPAPCRFHRSKTRAKAA